MVATLNAGSISQRVRVRCIGGEINDGDVAAACDLLDLTTPATWLISDRRVSEGARRASKTEKCRVFTLSEFLRGMVWGPYLERLHDLVEKTQLDDLYVDPACFKQVVDDAGTEKAKDTYTSLDRYIDAWLGERGKMHISVLGEFGAGKTWFCRHYAARQLRRYFDNPAGERFPLLVTLRTFAKSTTPQQLINHVLLEQYELAFVGSAFSIFNELNRNGKLLLILDGFDEMARKVDHQTVIDNFWELASLVAEPSKVILTSRTEYFGWAKESEEILAGRLPSTKRRSLAPPQFEIIHISPFSDDQIRNVIVRRQGAQKGAVVADAVLGSPNLAALARKPVLIELLQTALEEVRASSLESSAQVYLYATDKLLIRNIREQKTFTSTSDKLFFLCYLAWEMITSGVLQIHFRSIPERIRRYFGTKITAPDLDFWSYDLRSQTLLHRDAAGNYEFAHKSLAEYFVAYKVAAETGCLSQEFRTQYKEPDGSRCESILFRSGAEPYQITFPQLSNEVAQFLGEICQGDFAVRMPENLKQSSDSHRVLSEAFRDLIEPGDLRGKLASSIRSIMNKHGVYSFQTSGLGPPSITETIIDAEPESSKDHPNIVISNANKSLDILNRYDSLQFRVYYGQDVPFSEAPRSLITQLSLLQHGLDALARERMAWERCDKPSLHVLVKNLMSPRSAPTA